MIVLVVTCETFKSHLSGLHRFHDYRLALLSTTIRRYLDFSLTQSHTLIRVCARERIHTDMRVEVRRSCLEKPDYDGAVVTSTASVVVVV